MLEALRAGFPGVDRFAQIFTGPLGQGASGVLATLLSSREAFLPDASGNINPRHTLEVLLNALDGLHHRPGSTPSSSSASTRPTPTR